MTCILELANASAAFQSAAGRSRFLFGENEMKNLLLDVFLRVWLILACVLVVAFLAAAVSDWIMGCGEGYWSANGYVEPDNKGCFFMKEVQK
jgi:hypothetical protein